jgi:DNA-binding NarL/FixJ family response regulator
LSDTVLIVDNHTLVREGIKAICETMGPFRVVAEAADGREAVALAGEFNPDIILMGIHMPGLNGVGATGQILRDNPEARVVMLTMVNQSQVLFDALKAGARGDILKDAKAEELISAIRMVLDGNISLPRTLAVKFLDRFRRLDAAKVPEPDRLTSAEMDVLQLVAQGLGNRLVASRLKISEKTVSNRLGEIFLKLKVTNRTQAALVAIRRGWASLYPEDT